MLEQRSACGVDATQIRPLTITIHVIFGSVVFLEVFFKNFTVRLYLKILNGR